MPLLGVPSIAQRKPLPVSIYGGDIPTLLYSAPELGGDGKTRLNPDKLLAKWRWIAATFGNDNTVAIPASATRTLMLEVKASGDRDQGDFEAVNILTRSADASNVSRRMAIRPYVNTPTCNRYLSNLAVPSTLISGVAQLPGVLRMGVYCLPKTSWQFETTNLDASNAITAQIVLHGRQFASCSPCASEKLRRRAMHLQWFHPYWIVPKDPTDDRYNGPEITLGVSTSQEITFPIPSDADFLMVGMLDDSSASDGNAPEMVAQVRQNDTQKGLVDLSGAVPAGVAGGASNQLGINWQNFLAIPSATVTGMSAGRVAAYSLAPSMAGITHLVPRNTQVVVRFTNLSASNTVTLRPALFGLLVYGRQPEGRDFSADGAAHRERIEQGEEFLKRMGLTSAFGTGEPR